MGPMNLGYYQGETQCQLSQVSSIIELYQASDGWCTGGYWFNLAHFVKARASFHKEKLFSNVGFGTNLVPKLYASKVCEAKGPTSQSTLHSHSTSNYITTLRPLWMNFFSQSNERWARYWMIPINRVRTLLNQSGSSIKYDMNWCSLFLIGQT